MVLGFSMTLTVETLAALLDRIEDCIREPCTANDRLQARGALTELRRLLPQLGAGERCMVPHDDDRFEYPNHTYGYRCRRCGREKQEETGMGGFTSGYTPDLRR